MQKKIYYKYNKKFNNQKHRQNNLNKIFINYNNNSRKSKIILKNNIKKKMNLMIK